MNDETVNGLKGEQRKVLREFMKDHPLGDSDAVVRELAGYFAVRPSIRVVALFAALRGEVDLRLLLGEIANVWVYPKVTGRDLVFREVRDFSLDLEMGSYGIMEPRDGLCEIAIGQVDAFLCPGLGFDRHGGRIGRGMGFYDRMLSRARKDALKIGVCFRHQLVDRVFMEDHDVPMDFVISD